MKTNSAYPPIIIIGMHRSGTSMIARMLEESGLFLGKKKDIHHEAFFFIHYNNWLLNQSGGAWDHPAPINYLFENKQARTKVVDYIRYLMETPHVASFLGWGKYLRYRTPLNLEIPWGWKDPRNTYTLPLWLDIFPNARVIHIYRHGIDVASSLKVRQETFLNSKKILYSPYKVIYWLRPKRGGFTDSLRCASYKDAFSLWEEYIEQARVHVRDLKDQAIEIKYEDFLLEPNKKLRSLANFCNLDINDATIAKLSDQVKKERAYAYKRDATLQDLTNHVAERLKAQGY